MAQLLITHGAIVPRVVLLGAPCLIGYRYPSLRRHEVVSVFARTDPWIPSADVAQLVAHHLAKVRVAGSNPVVRSEGLA